MSLGRSFVLVLVLVVVVVVVVLVGSPPATGVPASPVVQPASSSPATTSNLRMTRNVPTYDGWMPDTPSPEITPRMRASAKANPNSWLYVIDPAFDADADIPPWGVVGAYRVDERGGIDQAFHPNTEYRPSPAALRMPSAATELERLLQWIVTGHREETELPAAVLKARLLIYATGPDDTAVTAFPDRTGRVMVPACTSVAHVPPAWPGWREIKGEDLPPHLSNHPLVINPTGPITALLPTDTLR